MTTTTIDRRGGELSHRSALLKVVDDPSIAMRYDALARAAHAADELEVAATAYALMLVCAGGLKRDTAHLFADRWFVPNARYFQFYYSAFADRGRTPTEDFQFERRLAAGPRLDLARRRAALGALVQPFPVDVESAAVLVCGMPKSASTFVSRCLTDYLGLHMITPHNHNDGTGTGFDVLRFLRSNRRGALLHSHLPANPRTLTMVRIFENRPIVTVRNIFDALRSYADHLAAPWTDANPGAAQPDWLRIAILRMAASYVDFFATWRRAAASGHDVHFVSFDQVRGDPEGMLASCLQHLGEPFNHRRAADVLARVAEKSAGRRLAIRFNVGRVGRGAEYSDCDRDLVRSHYAMHPDVDFSEIDPGF